MYNYPILGVAEDIYIHLTQEQLHEFEKDIFQKTHRKNDNNYLNVDMISIDDLNIILKKYLGI